MKVKEALIQTRNRRGTVVGVAQLVVGWLGVLFFGLALLGFVVSAGNRLGQLPSAVVTALLFGVCLWLIRRGGRGLRASREKGRTDPVEPSPQRTAVEVGTPPPESTPPQQGAATAPPPHNDLPEPCVCPSCMAKGLPDGDGRCEYCRGAL